MRLLHWSDDAVAELCELVLSGPARRKTRFVMIDGRGGAGKSTVAEQVCSVLAASVVHLDELAIDPTGPNLDRLEREVLAPLSRGNDARYLAWDWSRLDFGEVRRIVPGGVVVIEGSGSASSTVMPYVDFAMWVECDTETRLHRTMLRDGDQVLGAWEQWTQWEDNYLQSDDPRSRVHLIVRTG